MRRCIIYTYKHCAYILLTSSIEEAPMEFVELIRKKREGYTLSTPEIDWLISKYTQDGIPDYQMSAWAMAVFWRGMDARETSDLTLAMARSGEELHARDIILA